MINNSGGRTSAVMTEELLKDEYIRANCIVTFQNTGREKDQTLDFIHNCDLRWQEKFGISVVWLEYNTDVEERFSVVSYETAHRRMNKTKKSPFEKLLDRYVSLPNVVARNCTAELKIRTVKRYMLSLGYKTWTACLGIRYDEPRRWAKNGSANERWDNWNPLVDWKITKPDVLKEIATWPFDLELKDYEGNCDLCFFKGIAKKRMIIREDPAAADWWIEMEEQKGQTFHKNYTYRGIRDKIKTAPEFKFDLEMNQDFECFCNID